MEKLMVIIVIMLIAGYFCDPSKGIVSKADTLEKPYYVQVESRSK